MNYLFYNVPNYIITQKLVQLYNNEKSFQMIRESCWECHNGRAYFGNVIYDVSYVEL